MIFCNLSNLSYSECGELNGHVSDEGDGLSALDSFFDYQSKHYCPQLPGSASVQSYRHSRSHNVEKESANYSYTYYYPHNILDSFILLLISHSETLCGTQQIVETYSTL